MLIRSSLAAFFFLFALGMTLKASAPVNDSFAGGTPIVITAGSTSINATNIDATREASEPAHAGNAGGRSVWFNFTPTQTAAIRINTVDTSLDTLLAVYVGTDVGNLTLVGYNDDCSNTCGQASSVDLMMVAGTTYHIAVDGYNDNGTISTGSFRLVLLDNGSPFADNFASAVNLGSSSKGSIAGTNFNASAEAGEPSAYTSANPNPRTVWYRWTASSTFSMAFEVTDTFDAQFAVFTSNAGSPTFAQLTKVKANIDAIHFSPTRYRTTFLAESGKTYYLKIDWHNLNTVPSDSGNFQLRYYPNRLAYQANMSGLAQKATVMVFRPQNGTWFGLTDLLQSNPVYFNWGQNGDTPIAADFVGDGNARLAAIRNSNGQRIWFIGSGGSTFSAIPFGLSSDKVVTGDFDLDGRADLAAIRNNGQNLVWYVRQSSNGALRTFIFGLPADRPIIGDFDGDGGTDVAVSRSSIEGLTWHILKSNLGNYNQYESQSFGDAPDKPAVQDYDGDGRSDIAVYRPGNGTWYILRSESGQLQTTMFWSPDDKPQPADYDGDGKADLAVFRPSQGRWYFWLSGTDAQSSIGWGLETDYPVTSFTSMSY